MIGEPEEMQAAEGGGGPTSETACLRLQLSAAVRLDGLGWLKNYREGVSIQIGG